MKRCLCVLLLIFLLLGAALGEDRFVLREGDSSPYISEGDCGTPIDALLKLLDPDAAKNGNGDAVFDRNAREALEAYQRARGLDVTGCFDPDTLCLLLDCPPDAREVWVPMHGGKKYHKTADCSGMLYPCRMPAVCAEKLGFSACGRCWKK